MAAKNSGINLRALDALRGLLATYVLAGHARWLLWEGREAWSSHSHSSLANALAAGSALLRYGHEAVMVFFVLSGFFIHMRSAANLAASDGAEVGFSLKDFLRRRARRLIPPYLFALLLTVSLDMLGLWLYPALYTGRTGDALLDQTFSRGGYSVTSVGAALVMLPSSLGRSFGSNGPLWSLGYEVVYYLLYPLWLQFRQRSGAWMAYGVGALFLLIPMLNLPPWFSVFAGVLAHYPIWLVGAALVEVAANGRWPAWTRWGSLVILTVVFMAIHQRSLQLSMLLPLYLLGGAAVVLLFARLPEAVTSWPPIHGWERLGICSYTIYICHFPILVLLSAILFQTLGARPASAGYALGGAALALLLCSLAFQLCEKPFLPDRRKQKLISKS